MNVTEDAMRDYIDVFHETLTATAMQFLPEEHRSSLLHVSLMPAEIIGYVSTQFGAGIEYKQAERTQVRTVRGNTRVEDLLIQAPQQASRTGPLFLIQEGSGGFVDVVSISHVRMEGAFPLRLAGFNAGCRVDKVGFRIGEWNREVFFAELFGNRRLEFWSSEQAVSRAKDEVLAALTQIKRAEQRQLNLAEYIAKFKERTVLLLGDYNEAGLQRLRSMATVLSERGYDPILIKDVPDVPAQDLTQKVATIGCMARFVLIDDSTKSGHFVEVQLARTYNWITVLLRQGGKGASWMTVGASATSNVIHEQRYDESNPQEGVIAAIAWAEAKIVELEVKFETLFPWREQS